MMTWKKCIPTKRKPAFAGCCAGWPPARKITIATAGFRWPAWSRAAREVAAGSGDSSRGTLIVPEDFDAPLPEDLLDLLEGRKKKRARKAKKKA